MITVHKLQANLVVLQKPKSESSLRIDHVLTFIESNLRVMVELCSVWKICFTSTFNEWCVLWKYVLLILL